LQVIHGREGRHHLGGIRRSGGRVFTGSVRRRAPPAPTCGQGRPVADQVLRANWQPSNRSWSRRPPPRRGHEGDRERPGRSFTLGIGRSAQRPGGFVPYGVDGGENGRGHGRSGPATIHGRPDAPPSIWDSFLSGAAERRPRCTGVRWRCRTTGPHRAAGPGGLPRRLWMTCAGGVFGPQSSGWVRGLRRSCSTALSRYGQYDRECHWDG